MAVLFKSLFVKRSYVRCFIGLQCCILIAMLLWSRSQAFANLRKYVSGVREEDTVQLKECLKWNNNVEDQVQAFNGSYQRALLTNNSGNNIIINEPGRMEVIKQFKEQEAINEERLANVRAHCEKYANNDYWKLLTLSGKVYTYPDRDINYCETPKVGCTFWKRVMRFLSKDYPTNSYVKRPADIDRKYAHHGHMSNIKKVMINNPLTRISLSSRNTFMFTRDPYSRLWSAYIDKLLLPDFWMFAGRHIVTKVRPNASTYEKHCANDVSFTEFILYVISISHGKMNRHWEPVHRICSPCHVNFDVIGKQETFDADSKFILNKYGLEELIEHSNTSMQVNEEVRMHITYNFGVEKRIDNDCLDKYDVAAKLWQAFTLNGYIDRDLDFPEGAFNNTTFLSNPVESFSNIVISTIGTQNRHSFDPRTQKRAMMVEAYRKISKLVLNKLQAVYKYDFELFGYDERPKDIFS